VLLEPPQVWTREEILTRTDCPVPRVAGLYAWYFKEAPPSVPVSDCHMWNGMPLLYVGISPKKPPLNGAKPSRQKLWNRIRYHMRGNAYGSTLRLTLGCLLSETLGIELRRVGSGDRLTFADGEEKLSDWIRQHARVAWMPHTRPWEVEERLIRSLSLPLNLQHNDHHPFHKRLTDVRKLCRESARRNDIWLRA
jgi:hypothetical protein